MPLLFGTPCSQTKGQLVVKMNSNAPCYEQIKFNTNISLSYISSQEGLQQIPRLKALRGILGALPAYYAEGCMTSEMKEEMSWSGKDYNIKTPDEAPVFKMNGVEFSMSSRCEVLGTEGQPRFTPTFYAWNPQEKRFLDIAGEFRPVLPAVSLLISK